MNTDPVETKIQIDDRDVRIKFDEFERRIKKFEESGKRAGKGGGAFMSAAIGGAAGFVAGAAMNNPATSAISDLLINVLAAALLPAIMDLVKILIDLRPILEGLGEVVHAVTHAGSDVVHDVVAAANGDTGPIKQDWNALLRPDAQQNTQARTAKGGQAYYPKEHENVSTVGQDLSEELFNFFHGKGWHVNRDLMWGPDIFG